MVKHFAQRCTTDKQIEEAFRFAEAEGYELVSMCPATGPTSEKQFMLVFKTATAAVDTTNIHNVEIKVVNNQDPNKVAKKTAEILLDLGKRPKLKKGDKVEVAGWFDSPILLTVDEMYPKGDGFVGSNEMGNFHCPYAADQLSFKKVK